MSGYVGDLSPGQEDALAKVGAHTRRASGELEGGVPRPRLYIESRRAGVSVY